MCADFVELVKIIWIAIGYVRSYSDLQFLYSMLHALYTLCHMSYRVQVQSDLCQIWYHQRCIERQLKGNVVGDWASERVHVIHRMLLYM